jgi:hypothetical protein
MLTTAHFHVIQEASARTSSSVTSGAEADAAFARAAGDGMLHAVAGEDFQAAIVQLDGDVDGDFLGRGAQDFAQTVVQIEAGGGLVKAGFGGQPGVLLLFERQRGACQK